MIMIILGESLFSLACFLDDLAEFGVQPVSLLEEFLADGGVVSALLSLTLHVDLVLKVIVKVDGLVKESAEGLVVSLAVDRTEKRAIVDECTDHVLNVLFYVSKIHILKIFEFFIIGAKIILFFYLSSTHRESALSV